MNPVLEDAILASFELIQKGQYLGTLSNFSSYTPCYFFTTEYIKAYLDEARPFSGRALTVIGSGDQIFNLAYKGFSHIDAFDVNLLTYYNYYLKRAIFMSLSYEEFNRINQVACYTYRPNEFKELLERIKVHLPQDVYEYYCAILSFASSSMVFGGFMNDSIAIYDSAANVYANSPENYEKLKRNISRLNVKFYFGDARVIPDMVPGHYDFITLSNVADYLGCEKTLKIEDFQQYIGSYFQHLNSGGSLVNYLYYSSGYVIANSSITMGDLGSGNIHKIPSTTESYYLVRKP